MADIFADTAGLANLFDVSEPFHELAASIFQEVLNEGRTFITTNYILTELVATLTNPLRTPREKVIGILDDIKASPTFKVIHIDTSLDNEAYELFRDREDKDWSLVDCASFVIMTRLGMREALTSDHHFEQAGFARLLM